MNIDCFFVIPIEHYLSNEASFYLMPDNGDVLPIDKIPAFIIGHGLINNSKLSKIENEVVIPRECYIVKCLLTADTVMHIKTQTTEFMSLEAYDQIAKNYPEAAQIIVTEAIDNLSMNTVKDLMINNTYGGRNISELYLLWPELNGLVKDVLINSYGED